MEDALIFGIVVGVVLAFIFFKWKSMNKKSETNINDTNVGGGGGYTGVNDNVAGELPKDRIE